MIYVDRLRTYGLGSYHDKQAARVGTRNNHLWCHLFSDEVDCEELHNFAAQIGMRRSWFQANHYDLVPSRRARAVQLGAKELSDKEAVAIWRAQRLAVRAYHAGTLVHPVELENIRVKKDQGA